MTVCLMDNFKKCFFFCVNMFFTVHMIHNKKNWKTISGNSNNAIQRRFWFYDCKLESMNNFTI